MNLRNHAIWLILLGTIGCESSTVQSTTPTAPSSSEPSTPTEQDLALQEWSKLISQVRQQMFAYEAKRAQQYGGKKTVVTFVSDDVTKSPNSLKAALDGVVNFRARDLRIENTDIDEEIAYEVKFKWNGSRWNRTEASETILTTSNPKNASLRGKTAAAHPLAKPMLDFIFGPI